MRKERSRSVYFSAHWISLVALIVLSAGCAGPRTYRYADHILIPPGIKAGTVAQRTATLPIASSCGSSEDGLKITPQGHATKVTVQPAKLAARPPGWLRLWGERLEEQGCLADDIGFVLAGRIPEIVPLDPAVTSRLLEDRSLVYRDLGPEHRLFSVGPILREGSRPGAPAIVSSELSGNTGTLTVRASPDLLGVETAWYAVQANTNGKGSRIVFLSAEDRIGDQVTQPSPPRLDYLHFSDAAAYYRFFLHTADSRSDHLAIVLAAPTRTELRAQTRALEADASVCAKAIASGMCVEAPFGIALSPALLATVNNVEIAIRDRWTVRGAVQAAGVATPESILPTLEIKRLYNGQLTPILFNRAKPDILDLPLFGKEVIRW